VAVEIAEAVAGALLGELSATAVNAPMVPQEVNIKASLFTCIALYAP
jgi:D-3-phosphoglycerate dehydrogenase